MEISLLGAVATASAEAAESHYLPSKECVKNLPNAQLAWRQTTQCALNSPAGQGISGLP
ncbi:hypothetical protein [Amycolatopsis benzoatilytica]|uniref:hypothetical protein n=1 Tax=Amycolatopsis benzoatilytica TaxID=346045 RepID=UPI0012B68D21|nr:hypothetical protein [Amycolatopsis benzoatilytica]